MPTDQKQPLYENMMFGIALLAAGLVVSAVSWTQIRAHDQQQMAQATPPLQTSPPSPADTTPAESKPGGTRPTTPAPEPARPDANAQNNGATPALPPAPAEKTAAPIK